MVKTRQRTRLGNQKSLLEKPEPETGTNSTLTVGKSQISERGATGCGIAGSSSSLPGEEVNGQCRNDRNDDGQGITAQVAGRTITNECLGVQVNEDDQDASILRTKEAVGEVTSVSFYFRNHCRC